MQQLPDTFTGRCQGLLDVKNVLRDLARQKEVRVRRQALIAGLAYQLLQVGEANSRSRNEHWGMF